MRHIVKFSAMAAAGCAVVALSACTAAAEAQPAPRQPATQQPTPTATATATTTATATAKPAATSAAPAGNRPGWTGVDFNSLTFDALNCPHLNGYRTAEVDSTHYADLNGDGRAEAIVAASCRTTTAQNPISVFVYDGTDVRVPLKRLLTVGDHAYLVTAQVTVRDRTMTVTSKALSDKAPRCCPDLLITQRYRWDGSRLAQTYGNEKAIS